MSVYVALLYGRNIFGSGPLTHDEIRAQLQALTPRVTLRAAIGQSGNLVLTTDTTLQEAQLRTEIERLLSVRCVVIAAGLLRSIFERTQVEIRPRVELGHHPFRTTVNGIEWEFGLVVSSDELSEPVARDGLFTPGDVAIALQVIQRRAWLVQKRRSRTNKVRSAYPVYSEAYSLS
jgi:hypothetical protein